MENFEKILLMDLVCKQLGEATPNNQEFVSAWQNLSQSEKEEYGILSSEIHEICTYINMPKVIDLKEKRVNSIIEYNERIKPVDERVLTLCKDFDLSLKEELTDEDKKHFKRLLGKDYLKWFDE